MELNILVLLFPVLLYFVIKLLDKKTSTKPSITIFMLKLILIVSSLILYIGNIGWLYRPFTKQLKVKVYDADTKKPLSCAHIRFSWLYETGTAGGLQSGPYKSINLRTDSNGEFTVPSQLKPISFYAIPLIIGRYSGELVSVFQHKYWSFAETYDGKISDIYLESLKSEEDEFNMLKSIAGASHNVSAKSSKCKDMSDDEITFLEDDFARLETEYPNSPLFEDVILVMISMYNACENKTAVTDMENKIVAKFPNGKYSRAIMYRINRSAR